MKTRNQVDPDLAILRAVALSADGAIRNELERARFKVFQAFETMDSKMAIVWLNVFRTAVLAAKAISNSDPDSSRFELSEQAESAISRLLEGAK